MSGPFAAPTKIGTEFSDVVGPDPCRHRAYLDKHETLCEHFQTCRSGKCCRAFNDYIQRNWFLAGEKKPSRYWYFHAGMEAIPDGHKCCKTCDAVKPLGDFPICNGLQQRGPSCKDCYAGRQRQERVAVSA